MPGHHAPPDPAYAATVAQPIKVDNELYVRDYGKCVLCYKCVEACGPDHQNTFAIAVAGRGFDARISTEFAVKLPESACVYCGNCIAVCPTGALMAKSEFDHREAGTWDRVAPDGHPTRSAPTAESGARSTLHVQDNEIVKATSPLDHEVTQRQSLHQGAVRLAVRAESAAGRKWERAPAEVVVTLSEAKGPKRRSGPFASLRVTPSGCSFRVTPSDARDGCTPCADPPARSPRA